MLKWISQSNLYSLIYTYLEAIVLQNSCHEKSHNIHRNTAAKKSLLRSINASPTSTQVLPWYFRNPLEQTFLLRQLLLLLLICFYSIDSIFVILIVKKLVKGNGAIFYCRGFSQTGLFCFKTCSMMLGYSTTDPKVCQEAGIVKRNGLKTIYLRI